MAKAVSVNVALLTAILQAEQAGQMFYIDGANGKPLLEHNPPLIDVDFNTKNENEDVAVKLTVAGKEMIMNAQNAASQATASAAAPKPSYGIITGAQLPQSKRGSGGGGAPVVYPFDQLEIGQSFFVPVSAKHKDPVKTLGSTVSSANMRWSQPTGEKKTVTRAKRGKKNKAILDAQGNKVMETVEVDVLKRLRKFTIRGVEKGKTYGNWTAEADGALIMRVDPNSNDEAA